MKRHKKIILLIGLVVLLVAAAAGFLVWRKPAARQTQPSTSETQESQAPIPSTPPQLETAQTPPQPPPFDKKLYSLTDPTSIWVIANKQRPMQPATYAPADLVDVGGGQKLRREAADALTKLFAGAQAQNLKLNPLSGYRSYARQQVVYQREVDTYGQAVADTESARPGHSEHQTCFAIDVGGGGCGIEDCFGNTAHGKWVAANAYKYGFIIRYPQGKQAITGYRYEPWHIRYVGVDLAEEMHKQKIITLEEFFGL